jgi:hypothetical protein
MNYFEFAEAKYEAIRKRWKQKWDRNVHLEIIPMAGREYGVNFPYIEAGIISAKHEYFYSIYHDGWENAKKYFWCEYPYDTIESIPEVTSIYTICSDNQPYYGFLDRFLEHYKDFKEIVVVMYRKEVDIKCDWPNVKIINVDYPINMAWARNTGLEAAVGGKYVMSMDIDTFLTKKDLMTMDYEWNNTEHMGVLNLRQHPSLGRQGNSFFFSRRLETAGWCEQFKGFFGEDTEYMMNWSKGPFKLPRIIFLEYDKVKHTPLPNSLGNDDLFDRIAKDGRIR